MQEISFFLKQRQDRVNYVEGRERVLWSMAYKMCFIFYFMLCYADINWLFLDFSNGQHTQTCNFLFLQRTSTYVFIYFSSSKYSTKAKNSIYCHVEKGVKLIAM